MRTLPIDEAWGCEGSALGADLAASRITAGSRIPGTIRSYQVTGGHEDNGS